MIVTNQRTQFSHKDLVSDTRGREVVNMVTDEDLDAQGGDEDFEADADARDYWSVAKQLCAVPHPESFGPPLDEDDFDPTRLDAIAGAEYPIEDEIRLIESSGDI